MSIQDCVQSIMQAAGGALNERDATDILDEIDRRAISASRKSGLSSNDAIVQEAEKLGREIEDLLKIHKANALWNGIKQQQRRSSYERARDSGKSLFYGLQSVLTGMNKEFLGNRLSVESVIGQKEREYVGGLISDLTNAGLMRAFSRGVHQKDMARELFELNNGTRGRPGKTGNPQALEAAKIIRKYQQKSVADLNREGAYIRDYNGHITKSMHDPDAIRGKGRWNGSITKEQVNVNRQAWVDFTIKQIDVDRMFGGDLGYAQKALEEMWGDLAKGVHLTVDDMNKAASPAVGANKARQISASRVFHWKDADAFLAYNDKYGSGDWRQSVVTSLQQSARGVGMMHFFGTNPEAQFDADLAWVTKNEDISKFTREEENVRARMAILTGKANRPENRVADVSTRALTMVQALSKLGAATITSFSDVPVGAALIGQQTNQGKALARYVQGPLAYFRGRGSAGSGRRLEADSLLVGMDSEIGQMASRFDTLDGDMRGKMGQLQGWYHKMTLLSAVTNRQRMDVQITLSHHYGKELAKPWASIGENERLTMRSYGIDEAEWETLRKGKAINPAGRGQLFEPSLARSVPDADMARLLGDLPMDPANLERVREDLAMRVGSWLHDSGTSGVIESGARERSMLLGDSRPGTTEGVARRLLTQFKAFPAALMTRAWGRALNSGRGFGSGVASALHLVVGMTVYGYASLTIWDFLQGRNPRPWNTETFMAAMAKGGGLSVLGDLALTNADKFGKDLFDVLAGPSVEMILDTGDVAMALKRGDAEKAGIKAQQIVSKNLPGANIWYMKIFVEMLFLRAWQEALNPGVLARREARDRREGITYWLPPTERAFP